MPLTRKGRKTKRAIEQHYGKNRGERIFYALQNKGKMKGTHRPRK